MSNQLPPAPEGFAWMPVSGELTDVALAQSSACYPLTGRPVEDSWEHRFCMWASVPEGFSSCRLMRRLGPTENPSKIEGARLRTGARWDPENYDGADWHAPVRFPRDHVPDFGKEGLRYLDDSEPSTADAYHYGMSGRVVPITLPPLPILDQMCAENPGLREGIDEEAQRLVDDEANRYISELKVEPMTERSDEIDALRAQLAEVTAELAKATREQGEAQAGWQRATERALLGAKENERLIAELAEARKTPMLFSLLRLVEDAYPPEGLMRHNVTLSGADGCVDLTVAHKGKWKTFTLSREDIERSAVEVFLEIEDLIAAGDI